MQGERIYPNDQGDLLFTKPGQYGKDPRNGRWYATVPTDESMLGNLGEHDVTEHEDGTITVSPSILVDDLRGKQWHGYLERGVWREV